MKLLWIISRRFWERYLGTTVAFSATSLATRKPVYFEPFLPTAGAACLHERCPLACYLLASSSCAVAMMYVASR